MGINEFLPLDYEVPNKENGYFRFKQGDNRFRIMTRPILGWEWWEDKAEGGRTPKRVRMDAALPVSAAGEAKHFWAFVVWNYNSNSFQILEITQKSIQTVIKGLWKDSDWGSPLGYDIVVSRSGEGLETEYSVTPKPQKAIDPAIFDKFNDLTINLEALYDGADPFSTAPAREEVREALTDEDIDEISETLKDE